MAKRLIFLKSYKDFDLYGVYKYNKFLYRLCLDKYQIKEIKEMQIYARNNNI